MLLMVVWLISVRLMAANQSLLRLSDFSVVISPWVVIILGSLKNFCPSLPDRLLQFTTAQVVGIVCGSIQYTKTKTTLLLTRSVDILFAYQYDRRNSILGIG